jgi:agmatine/peptidylarginine deiminase
MPFRTVTCLAAALCTAAALAQTRPPQYPEGQQTPRYLTPEERSWLKGHPWYFQDRGESDPPTGFVRCPSEYEPMDGLLMAWEGGASWNPILTAMAVQVTGALGHARVYMAVDSQSEQTSCSATLAAAGVDMSRVVFVVHPTDTIWIRDYGPRYIYQGGCRAIVDHIYNRPRPQDDAFPAYFSTFKQHPMYSMNLIHGGGNYHLDSFGRSYATRLVVNENPNLTEAQIIAKWHAFQNVNTTLFDPFPTSIDSTQHLDMWMQVIGDTSVIISDWPTASGSPQDVVCDNAATLMTLRGYTVYRTPAIHSGGVHYTFTNAVMCNGVVMIPKYTQNPANTYNDEALAVYQEALPDKTIVQIDCTQIISAAGALHCIVMHVPVNQSGNLPEAYLVSPQGGDQQQLSHGQQVEIRWLGDDDNAVTGIDLWMDAPFGSVRPEPIARNIGNSGSYVWTVPSNPKLRIFKLRVDAKDAEGHVARSYSSGTFTIR